MSGWNWAHGSYVDEAANAFEIRVKACIQQHESHLHVYISAYTAGPDLA